MKDIQNPEDTRGVDIQKVGIKYIEMALIIQRKKDKGAYGSFIFVNCLLDRAYRGEGLIHHNNSVLPKHNNTIVLFCQRFFIRFCYLSAFFYYSPIHLCHFRVFPDFK